MIPLLSVYYLAATVLEHSVLYVVAWRALRKSNPAGLLILYASPVHRHPVGKLQVRSDTIQNHASAIYLNKESLEIKYSALKLQPDGAVLD